jgi:hypothetical protein
MQPTDLQVFPSERINEEKNEQHVIPIVLMGYQLMVRDVLENFDNSKRNY